MAHIQFELEADNEDLEQSFDRANRSGPVAQTAAEIVAQAKCPYTFSVNGGWGSGKTVFMKWVKYALDTLPQHREKIRTVWFDAWKFEALGNLVYPLMMEIERQLTSKSKVKRWFKKDWTVSLRRLTLSLSWIPKYGWLMAIPATILSPSERGEQHPEQDYKRLREWETRLASGIQDLLCASSKEKDSTEKLVIFIDNLDRCLPENVVLLLESIKVYFRTSKSNFVLGIDADAVADGIKAKYGNNVGLDGHKYLEKVVQFSFDLTLSTEQLVDNIILNFSDEQKTLFKSTLVISREFPKKIFGMSRTVSIRTIRRVFNRFEVMVKKDRYELGGRQETDSSYDYDYLFFLVFLYYVYPKLFLGIIENRGTADFLNTLSNYSDDTLRVNLDPIMYPESVRPFLSFIKTTKAREIIQQFKQAKLRVTKDQVTSRPMDGGQILRCAEYVQHL